VIINVSVELNESFWGTKQEETSTRAAIAPTDSVQMATDWKGVKHRQLIKFLPTIHPSNISFSKAEGSRLQVSPSITNRLINNYQFVNNQFFKKTSMSRGKLSNKKSLFF